MSFGLTSKSSSRSHRFSEACAHRTEDVRWKEKGLTSNDQQCDEAAECPCVLDEVSATFDSLPGPLSHSPLQTCDADHNLYSTPTSSPPSPLYPIQQLSPTPLSTLEHRESFPNLPLDADARTPHIPHPLRLSYRVNKALESQTAWLILYFFFNLGLTLYNKGVLERFPFPYTLTALHALCGSAGGYLLLERGIFEPKHLTLWENVILVGFSVLYTINIAVSNLSLRLVTVPFHQVVRASTPIFTMIVSTLLLGTRFSRMKLISLLPVMAGVGFATYGDYYFTTWGLFLTLFGTFLAALKTVFTNLLQSPKVGSSTSMSSVPDTALPMSPSSVPRLHLHPLDLLTRMSPLAFIQCVLFAYLTGELDLVRHYSARDMSRFKAWALFTNGWLAFGLNVVSFTANKKVGALSMTVAANVKQVLTILFAVSLFDLTITPVNAVGIVLTLIGGAWYASVEYHEKLQRKLRLMGRS